MARYYSVPYKSPGETLGRATTHQPQAASYKPQASSFKLRHFVAVDMKDYIGYIVCRSSPTGEANRLNEGVSGGGPAGNATGWIIKNKSALKRSSMRAAPKPSVLPVDSNVKMVNGAAEGRGHASHHMLPVSSHKLTSSQRFKLQATSFKRVTQSFKLQAASDKLQDAGAFIKFCRRVSFRRN